MIFSIAVFAPLIGALIAGLPGRYMGDRAARLVAILFMLLASVCGVTVWVQHVWGGAGNFIVPVATWISAGNFQLNWALQADTLSTTMVAMVTCVATLIHVYSVGYMAHEHSTVSRFFSYLSLFTFAMLMLVTASNLVQLFFGWEGVGLASYLLIGYWYDRPSACRTAWRR
jgi:NADH-quinone oxidoreductase subunit L